MYHLKVKQGNKITSVIFRLLYGKKISDTQTGLRGVGNMFNENHVLI